MGTVQVVLVVLRGPWLVRGEARRGGESRTRLFTSFPPATTDDSSYSTVTTAVKGLSQLWEYVRPFTRSIAGRLVRIDGFNASSRVSDGSQHALLSHS